MPGLGIGPLGGAMPFGLGTPAAPSTVPTGNTTASRYIHPTTGELEIDSETGHLRQMSRVMQQVLLALRTELGSAMVDRTFGYETPKKMTPRFEAEVDAQIRVALRHLTDVQKSVTIINIEVTRGNASRYSAVVRYRNNDSGEEEVVPPQ